MAIAPDTLPAGMDHVRSTPEFDEVSTPAGLLAAHRVAAGVWGLLVVRSGAIDFVFEADPSSRRTIVAGETQVIPPGEPHHVELSGPVRFVVEFHRPRRPLTEVVAP